MPSIDVIVSLPFLINNHCFCLLIGTLFGLLPESMPRNSCSYWSHKCLLPFTSFKGPFIFRLDNFVFLFILNDCWISTAAFFTTSVDFLCFFSFNLLQILNYSCIIINFSNTEAVFHSSIKPSLVMMCYHYILLEIMQSDKTVIIWFATN